MMIVIRFILRIVLLPVQAILTLLMLAIDFIGGLANLVCWVLGDKKQHEKVLILINRKL